MATKAATHTPPVTVGELIQDLRAHEGEKHIPWHEVAGAKYGSVLRAAVQGAVEITEDGGLRFVGQQP